MAFSDLKIKSALFEKGACLVGFADIGGLPADVTGSMGSAISIAVALDASIINEIEKGPTERYFHEYNRANELLGRLGHFAAEYLNQHGHEAIAAEPTVEELDYETLATRLPHKTIATRAGLGWIGKSALLVTEQYGPAIRLTTVLTDAEFETATPVEASRCGDCNECVSACPANAITGKNWEPQLSREAIYNAFACCDTAKKLSAELPEPETICGICINACPWTQKYISRELTS